MRVDELDVTKPVKEVIINRGLIELYPPQEDAVKTGVLKGRNLVMASPTASGKTLIAELCAMKHVVERSGKVLYMTPLRALAWEKYELFQDYAEIEKSSRGKIRIGISTGDLDSSTSWIEPYDIVITTNEKCDSLLRHRSPWMDGVSLVVADEIHLINGNRGPTLEVALTRLRQIKQDLQVLALSATVRNADEVADWLGADFVTTDWRPVELREGVAYNNGVIFRDGTVKPLKPLHQTDVINIALNSVLEGGQALIFVESRRRSMSIAREVATALAGTLSKRELSWLQEISSTILVHGEKTKISDDLASFVSDGAAFHHAGLATIHRRIVEDSFKAGRIKVIAATPTLAAGVNLPARTVVVGSYRRFVPGYGMLPISILEYKQMSGRAGRPQYDEYGEAILIAQSSDEQDELMENYVLGKPERLYSRLGQEAAIRSHTLAAIASDYAHSEGGLLDFFGGTFYGYHYPPGSIKLTLSSIMRYLVLEGMIDSEGEYIYSTDFGRRVSELYIDPVSAVVLREGLRSGALDVTDFTWLHLVCHTPDMRPILRPRRLDEGLVEDFIEEHRKEFAVAVPDDYDYVDYGQFLGEVKTALVLNAWIEERSENELFEQFSVQPGDRYSAIQNAEWLLYSAHELAQVLSLPDYMRQLGQLQRRVKYGVTPRLLPLVRLRGIGRVRARLLYNSGFTSVAGLRRAPLNKLVEIPLIGSRLAKIIKEQVGGVVEENEWRRLQREETEQKSIIEFFEEENGKME